MKHSLALVALLSFLSSGATFADGGAFTPERYYQCDATLFRLRTDTPPWYPPTWDENKPLWQEQFAGYADTRIGTLGGYDISLRGARLEKLAFNGRFSTEEGGSLDLQVDHLVFIFGKGYEATEMWGGPVSIRGEGYRSIFAGQYVLTAACKVAVRAL